MYRNKLATLLVIFRINLRDVFTHKYLIASS